MPDAVAEVKRAAGSGRDGPADSPAPPQKGACPQKGAWNLFPERTRAFLLGTIAPTLIATVAFLAFLLQHQQSLVVILAGVGACLLLTPGLVVLLRMLIRHVYGWRITLARLNTTLQRVRQGTLPIDELTRIEGSFAPLAAQCRDLVIELRQKRAALAAADDEARQLVANRTSALERLVGSLRHQANRDPLTGLHNRRLLEPHLAELIAESRASSQDLCILMLDLDCFKALNDTLGHSAGDQFLRSVGQIIRSAIRPDHDAAFRTGGDEFVITLPESTPEAGAALAERLTSLIGSLGKTTNPAAPTGLSAGCASLCEIDDPTPARLLEAADRKLYTSKSSRRDAA